MVTHVTCGLSITSRNVTSLSFFASEKSIEVDRGFSGVNGSLNERLISVQKPKERTEHAIADVDTFECIRTPHH